MKDAVLFPFDLKASNYASYFYVLELAARTGLDLTVVSAINKPGKWPFVLNLGDKPKKQIEKRQLHLKLLELNGIFYDKYMQWKLQDRIKVQSILQSGKIYEVLSSVILDSPPTILACDHQTFTQQLLPFDFIQKTKEVDYQLWVLPPEIEHFEIPAELSLDSFSAKKKEVFGNLLWQARLYNMPNDGALIKSEYKKAKQGSLIY